MATMLRKTALPATITFLCLLIGVNAYVTWRNLKLIRTYEAQRLDASDTHSGVVAVEKDLLAIETGQRGYLLTGDAAYLAAYTQTTQNLPLHFSALRARLASRSAEERSVEAELESVAGEKIAEANDTIRLREKGYRHRAFLVVDSNRGKDLMDRAHALLDKLSAGETANITQYDRRLNESVGIALQEFALGSGVLLALTVVTIIAFDKRRTRLELSYSRQTEELRATTRELDRFTSTVSNDVRSAATEIRNYAESLLNAYGGFLPRQGQERAVWISEGCGHINRVLDRLLAHEESDLQQAGAPGRIQMAAPKEHPKSQTA